MIKRVLTFVSGLQESVLVDFRGQNKVKILHKVKTSQNSSKISLQKRTNLDFFYFFEFLSCY